MVASVCVLQAPQGASRATIYTNMKLLRSNTEAVGAGGKLMEIQSFTPDTKTGSGSVQDSLLNRFSALLKSTSKTKEGLGNNDQRENGMMRPPGNMLRDSAPPVYLQEFLNIPRPAYKPDGRGSDSVDDAYLWLSLLTADNIYKSESKKEDKSAREVSNIYLENARGALKKSVLDGKLKFTTDGASPRAFEYRYDYQVKNAATAAGLAREQLGANASPEQVEKYASVLASINGLENIDKEIGAGTHIKLPGQTEDGGITHRYRGKTITDWYDETRFEINERGQGKATFEDRGSGCKVEVNWDPDDKSNCKLTRTFAERQVSTDATGVRVERVPPDWGRKSTTYQDERGRTVTLEYNPKDDKLQRAAVQDWKSGVNIELLPDEKGDLRGKKTNKEGDVIATMVGTISGADKLTMYEELKLGDLTKKTFENGTVEEWRADKLWNRKGTDEWGRQVEERYRPPGRVPPHQILVTINDDSDSSRKNRLTFTRTDFGEYWGETKRDGKTDMRFQLRPSGQIMFYQGQKTWSDLKDDTHIERRQTYDSRDPQKVSGYKVSEKKDGAIFEITADRDGNILSDFYSYGGLDGRTVERTRSTNGRLISGIKMNERTGFKTDLKYDVVSGMFTGKRVDSTGKAVEDVVVADDKIIYTQPDGNRRVEVFDVRARDLLGVKPKAGTYDVQRGTETFQNDDESVSVNPVAPGRTDKVIDDPCFGRYVDGSTIRGERSQVTPERTVVHNPDGTGIRLNEDLSVDRWGPNEKDNADHEKLLDSESDFLKYLKENNKEQEIDLRDLLEIHQKYVNRDDGKETLARFYDALKKLDTAKHLTDEERGALRSDLMHDVAHPEEMDQSRSPTCNSHVIRREMAMNLPDRYVMEFVSAMSDGEVPVYTALKDGAYTSNKEKPDATVKVDPDNLKLADCTGRNLASRIFDNLCIQTLAQPDYNWRATEDGLGKFVPTDPKGEPKEFTGMQMGEIAEVLSKLTGVKRGVVQVGSVDDLRVALDANGKDSMIVAVNASKMPFTWQGINFDYDELYTNHVVTLTNMFKEGGRDYVNYMNQWGLQEDHSTNRTKVPASIFFNNMVGLNSSWRGARPVTPPQVISAGDPTKVHKVVDGKVVVDPRYCIKDGRVQEVQEKD